MATLLSVESLLRLWSFLEPIPGGRWLFSVLLGLAVPYTGSISPRVETLARGCVRVRMADRRGVRNHLRSIHALALANLGELAGGLAVAAGLPPGHRFIPTGLSIDYLKKARGTLVGECTWEPDAGALPEALAVPVRILNAAGEEVARLEVRYKIGRDPAADRGAGA